MGNFQGSGAVYCLTVHGGELYAAGNYETSIVRWDGSHWQPVGEGAGTRIDALTTYNNQLIAGGADIWRWDGSSWQTLGGGVSGPGGLGVHALQVYNGGLFVGGGITVAGGQPAAHIARWDGSSWQSVGGGMNWDVRAFTVYNGELIAGGWFTLAGGVIANRIAHWDGVSWRPFGGGTVDRVRALANFGSRVVAGGQFSQPAVLGGTAQNIVAWDGVKQSPLGTGMNIAKPPGLSTRAIARTYEVSSTQRCTSMRGFTGCSGWM